MIPQRKRPAAPKAPELEFDTTQEIDPALVDSILAGREPTLMPGDFDDTEVLLDVGKPAKSAPRR
jgi:hypothetical protein